MWESVCVCVFICEAKLINYLHVNVLIETTNDFFRIWMISFKGMPSSIFSSLLPHLIEIVSVSLQDRGY